MALKYDHHVIINFYCKIVSFYHQHDEMYGKYFNIKMCKDLKLINTST